MGYAMDIAPESRACTRCASSSNPFRHRFHRSSGTMGGRGEWLGHTVRIRTRAGGWHNVHSTSAFGDERLHFSSVRAYVSLPNVATTGTCPAHLSSVEND